MFPKTICSVGDREKEIPVEAQIPLKAQLKDAGVPSHPVCANGILQMCMQQRDSHEASHIELCIYVTWCDIEGMTRMASW